MLGNLPQTEHVFFVSGYIPEKYGAAVEKELTGRYEAVVERTQIDEGEEAPVLLQNNSFASSVEGVISAFGLPGKGDIDPSMITAVCYVFLFGLMLSDAALRRAGFGGLCGGSDPVSADGGGDEKISAAVFLVRTLHPVLGNYVRRIFRRRD